MHWRDSARLGSVYAITDIHAAGHPAFKSSAPFSVVLVEMDEGFRIMTNVVGDAGSITRIGDRGRIVFETRGSVKLPQFRPEAVEGD